MSHSDLTLENWTVVADFLPTDLSVLAVSPAWKEIWAPYFRNFWFSSLRQEALDQLEEVMSDVCVSLHLYFRDCPISVQGANAVVARFPGGLRSLTLNFSRCRVEIGGVRTVLNRLPAGLFSLSLNFTGCDVHDRDAQAVGALVARRGVGVPTVGAPVPQLLKVRHC